MSGLMGVLLGLSTIVQLVCFIMVLIKIFKVNVGLGILGLFCNIFTFVYGWVKVKEFNAKTIMLVWTVALVVWMVAYGFGASAMIKDIMEQMQSTGA